MKKFTNFLGALRVPPRETLEPTARLWVTYKIDDGEPLASVVKAGGQRDVYRDP